MANTILTHQMIAREAAKMLEEEAPFIANINKGRQDEFGKDVQGYQKGDTVKIKIPTAGRVYNGSVFAEGGGATDVVEESVDLKLDTQKHVALQFGAKEKQLTLTDFRDRILRPQAGEYLVSQPSHSYVNNSNTASASMNNLMNFFGSPKVKAVLNLPYLKNYVVDPVANYGNSRAVSNSLTPDVSGAPIPKIPATPAEQSLVDRLMKLGLLGGAGSTRQ